MKKVLLLTFHTLLLLCLASLSGRAAAGPDLERIAFLHWHPDTATEARRLTLAAADWLEAETDAVEDWSALVNARALSLARRGEQVPETWSPLADGVFAWLVQAREHNLAGRTDPFPEPTLRWPDGLVHEAGAAGRIARLKQVAAMTAPVVWSRVAQRLETSPAAEDAVSVDAFWQDLQGSDQADPARIEFARGIGRRVVELAAVEDAAERVVGVNRILLTRAHHEWDSERALASLWLAFEALARLAATDTTGEEARRWTEWLETLEPEQLRGLRQVDIDLPVVAALLEDAAGHLVSSEPSTSRALGELADAYARLALFMPDVGFYLDQPVRAEIRETVAACTPDPLLVGPMPREVYERCVRNLSELMVDGLATEELAGGAQGPFAPEFLRRELGLVSWQRAAYLDGHLGWMLDVPCEPPQWVNVLEWSLVIEHLMRWVPQRPVYFAGPRWQGVLTSVREAALDRTEAHREWMDCISGHGRERRDPVQHLLDRHEDALLELEALLIEAGERFYRDVVRPGADIDLDSAAAQVTGYRPESLMVRPCPQAETCGARAELSVSRALLGLFPNAYLLADQLEMGEMGLCYENVRWIDRQSRPARQRDGQVANYEGRLSFDLVGTFARHPEAEVDTVFRYRLSAAESRHYLFAAADPDMLELDCPRDLIGKSVASTLPEERLRLIPDRLTYFVSAPTTPEAELLANWDRGAEWRDWFVTGDRVERLESLDGAALEVAVQARLSALSARRERQLAAPLTSPVRADGADPLALAMARVADSTAMLRRLLEIHYPRLIRHHDPVRAMLAGEAGLLNRERVRALRDEGVSMIHAPRIGRERAQALREKWMELPADLREHGQRAPEVDFAFERLQALIRLSRYESEPAVSERQEAP